jgi:hypothetical protein
VAAAEMKAAAKSNPFFLSLQYQTQTQTRQIGQFIKFESRGVFIPYSRVTDNQTYINVTIGGNKIPI